MVSTTRVISTGLPRRLQLLMTAFCASAIFSGSTSRPRLPRLMMMASDASVIAWKLNSACLVSHLAASCMQQCIVRLAKDRVLGPYLTGILQDVQALYL